jgi:hypothetical protein
MAVQAGKEGQENKENRPPNLAQLAKSCLGTADKAHDTISFRIRLAFLVSYFCATK